MNLKVIPHAKETKLVNNKLYLKSSPEKGKANAELIKFFKKKFNQKVRIVKGKKSREKVLEFL